MPLPLPLRPPTCGLLLLRRCSHHGAMAVPQAGKRGRLGGGGARLWPLPHLPAPLSAVALGHPHPTTANKGLGTGLGRALRLQADLQIPSGFGAITRGAACSGMLPVVGFSASAE